MNEGKRFERDFKASMPEEAYFLRLSDPAAAFSPGEVTRFSPHNPYDCLIFIYPNLFTLELKSTGGTSMSFWRRESSAASPMIKKHQIQGLLKASQYTGVVSGLILNFRTASHTYFWEINMFVDYTGNTPKKSVNEKDVLAGGGIIIPQRRLSVNWRYDMEEFINVTVGTGTKGLGRADASCSGQ